MQQHMNGSNMKAQWPPLESLIMPRFINAHSVSLNFVFKLFGLSGLCGSEVIYEFRKMLLSIPPIHGKSSDSGLFEYVELKSQTRQIDKGKHKQEK